MPREPAECGAQFISSRNLEWREAVLSTQSDERVDRVKEQMPRRIQMRPCALEDGELIALNIRNSDQQNAARCQASHRLLDQLPGISQVLQRMPESNHIEAFIFF